MTSCTSTFFPNLILLQLHPGPVDELVDEDGRERDLEDGPAEGLVEVGLGEGCQRKGAGVWLFI